MLKIPIAKTAPITIALCALSLTPLAAIAIEDCGTSVTECELRQEIKDLRTDIRTLKSVLDTQQQRIADLERQNQRLRGISVFSKSGYQTQLTIDSIGAGSDAILFFNTVKDNTHHSYNTARLVADSATGGTSPTLGFDIIDGDAGGWNRTLTIKATLGSETSGNVGIGTTNPGEKLDVNGKVKAKAFKTGDIFFEKDGQTLWQMFEDENGLYVKQIKTGKTYRLVLEEVQ